jgi:hypothetical protein
MTNCIHHWLISTPKVAYSQPGMKGDLVERTEQTCKKCGVTRQNAIVLPAEQVI